MASGQSYPSPSQAQVGGGAGPFYGHQNDGGHAQADVPSDLQISADLSRAIAPMMGSSSNGGHENATQHHQQQNVFDDRQPTSSEQMAQNVMGLQQDHSQAVEAQQTLGSASSRKRSKVSRACDECRRKKIRCDATTENEGQPCSSCSRTGAQCRFSRQPMKRGPSKGYIKELADRLNQLENHIAPQNMHQQQPQSDMGYLHGLQQEDGMVRGLEQLQDFSPPSGAFPRKRTHSMSEGYSSVYNLPQRQSVGGNYQEPLRQMSHLQTAHPGPSSDMRLQYSPSGPNPHAYKFSPHDTGRRESIGMSYDPDLSAAVAALQWDESAVDQYYHDVLKAHLASCSPATRDLFLSALDCAVRPYPSAHPRPDSHFQLTTDKFNQLSVQCEIENAANRGVQSNIVYAQSLALMVLVADKEGPAVARGEFWPPHTQWLARVVDLLIYMKANQSKSPERYLMDPDPDSNMKLVRRLWWVVFVMDKWHALSTADPPKIQEYTSTLLVEDKVLLGEATYHLVRLSAIMGHIAEVVSAYINTPANTMSPLGSTARLLRLTLEGELSRFCESSDAAGGSSTLVTLAYQHTALLAKCLNSQCDPREIIGIPVKMAALLRSSRMQVTPLNHHFAALAALVLYELQDTPHVSQDVKDGARRGFADIEEALGPNRMLAIQEDGLGWDAAIRDFLARKSQQPQQVDGTNARMGLQHLADAAIKEGRGDVSPPPTAVAALPDAANLSVGAVWNPIMLTTNGYLASMSEDSFRMTSL
ncbi:hypothetical protein LTR04_003710 [Oleoguttula sp. CCFEE 6159]|nr:hypothetical protein LTR04_003710 [Oleoguttula sp. CCFEE 6159]